MPSKTKAINYTVEVVDKTGKAIHTSKTILGALREARDAYKNKRAERKAEREAEKAARRAIKQRAYEEELREARRARREARRAIEDDGRSEERRRERRERKERRMLEGGDNQTERGDNGSDTSSIYSAANGNRSVGELTIKSTTDLALPPLPTPPPEVDEEDDHLTALFVQVQDIIDHAAAAQSSVFTLVEALRRDPETLAMVGITLAEISTVVAKLTPTALAGLKVSWPVVFSFLASPQFAIMAGVGIGTTVILLGGYKIIKKMIYGEPAKPPEIIDMGGTVVDEGDVRTITEAGEATPLPPPVPPKDAAPKIDEIRIDDAAREREREKYHKSKKEAEEDPMAFGHYSERKRSRTHRGEGSRRASTDEFKRPSQIRSHTAPVDFRSADSAIMAKIQEPEAPALAFEIPKKDREGREGKSHRDREHREHRDRDRDREHRSKSSKSEDKRERSDDKDRKSSKRERDTKEVEDGLKALILRRRK
ncbi:hypothetical protein TWF694_011367 [Orbilia ellipsospora]|uniref:Uncharacterized protein n=1 Tax=Orbilia ellipsospora TaxID=2528407 RepID=A0AAV9X508_9PEZI